MDDDYDMIEKYLGGDLDGNELAAFEKKLKSDDQLKEDLLLVKRLRFRISLNAKNHKKEAALKESLNALGDKYFTTEVTPIVEERGPYRLLFRLAAAIILLLLCFFGAKLTSQHFYSNQALANQFYVSLEDGERGSSQEAINKLSSLQPSDSLYLFYQYQLGDAYVGIPDFKKAFESFSIVLEGENNPAYDKTEINFEAVRWNRLQAALALGRTEQVLLELETMLQSDISQNYKDRAKKLIKKLNGYWYKLADWRISTLAR